MGAGFSPGNAANSAARAFNSFNLASFVIGAEAANVINVAVALKDARGRVPAGPVAGRMFLSDSADGSTLTATAATSALAVGTNGVLLATPTSAKVVDFITDSTGRIDLNIPQTAAPVTYYLAVVLPDGSLAVSGAITFA